MESFPLSWKLGTRSKSQSQSFDETDVFLLPLPDGKDGSIRIRGPLMERRR
jgi:hypothetical protein